MHKQTHYSTSNIYMEIPEINMIGNFQVYNSFWKWGAVIFAVFATYSYTSLINRIKLFFIHLININPPSNQSQEIYHFSKDDVISFASSDDEHDDEEDEEETKPTTTTFVGQHHVDEDFCVKGSKNVVKLWNGLHFDDQDLIEYDSPNDVVSLWDFGQRQKTREYSNIPAMVMACPAEGQWKGNGVVLSCYDTRMPRHNCALHAEWRSPVAAVTGVFSGGDGMVCVRDDVSGVVTVGDVRRLTVSLSLESVRGFDGDIWWDADAVIVRN